MLFFVSLALFLSHLTLGSFQTCTGFAGMQFYVTSTAVGGLSVVPTNQNPGDIGLCAENSATSDQTVTMFYRTSRRILLANTSHEIEQTVSRGRSLQTPERCIAQSGNQNIGPFPILAGAACVDGPPWCSSEVGLSYYVEFSNTLTTVSVWHCCRASGSGCGEIVSSSSFSTTPMATPGLPPSTPSITSSASPSPTPTLPTPPTPSATPSPTPTFVPLTCASATGMAFFVTANAGGLQVVPTNQAPGDIGLCAENSPLSDRAITMFYRTGVRRQLLNGSSTASILEGERKGGELALDISPRSLQSGFWRCEAPSGNQNIGPFPLNIGSVCVDGPPWCSSEVGLSYYIEFAAPGLTTVSVFHCCRGGGAGCGEIVSSESFSTTPMATISPTPTMPPSPTPSPTGTQSLGASDSTSPTATPTPSPTPSPAGFPATSTVSTTTSTTPTTTKTPPPSPSRSLSSSPGGVPPSAPDAAASSSSSSMSPGAMAGASIGGLLVGGALIWGAVQLYLNVKKSKAAHWSQGSKERGSGMAQKHHVVMQNPLGGGGGSLELTSDATNNWAISRGESRGARV